MVIHDEVLSEAVLEGESIGGAAEPTMWEKFLEFINTYVNHFIINFIIAVLVLVIGLKLVKFITSHLEKRRAFLKLDSNAGALILNAIKIALNALVIIVAVEILGVPSATIVTVLGSCGLAIGLALQGGLSNIAGGVMIMLFKPFRFGDYICTQDGDGYVEDIGLFYTKLETIDRRGICIPNSVLSSTTVVNLFAKEVRGVDMDISLAYGSDIDLARKVLLRCAADNPLVLDEPASKVLVTSHDDSCVKIVFRVFVKRTDIWQAKAELLEAAFNELPKAGLEIPFPQVDVHMKD